MNVLYKFRADGQRGAAKFISHLIILHTGKKFNSLHYVSTDMPKAKLTKSSSRRVLDGLGW